jgi:Flp pilus assembly protein TadD
VEAEHAARLDPQTALALAQIYYFQHRYDEAYSAGQRLLDQRIIPARHLHDHMARVCVSQGKFDEAVSEARLMRELSNDSSVIASLARILARAGKTAEARSLLDEVIQLTKQRYVSPVNVAGVCVALGERERAFEWLQTAYEIQCDHLLSLNVDPRWDGIRADPRFQALLKKVGFEK